MADLIAKEIVKQIGGINRLVAMTGAYDFTALKNGVAFKIKNAKANYIKINLTSADLYDLEVGRIRKGTYTVVKEDKGLYVDMLKPSIEKATGMYLSLAKGGKLCKKDEGVSIMLEDGGKLGFENQLWNNVTKRSMDKGGKLESDWVVEFLRKDSDNQRKAIVDVKANSYSSAKAKACIKTGFLPKNYNFNIYEKMEKGSKVSAYNIPPSRYDFRRRNFSDNINELFIDKYTSRPTKKQVVEDLKHIKDKFKKGSEYNDFSPVVAVVYPYQYGWEHGYKIVYHLSNEDVKSGYFDEVNGRRSIYELQKFEKGGNTSSSFSYSIGGL